MWGAVVMKVTRPCLSTLKGRLELCSVADGLRALNEWSKVVCISCAAGWQQVQGEPSNRLKAQADWCSIAPGPGCPSNASNALSKPVSASCAARQPTERALRASPIQHLDARLFEAIARTPVRRFQCAIQARLRQLRCPSAHATHTALEHCPSFPTTAESDRPAPGCPSHASCVLSEPF